MIHPMTCERCGDRLERSYSTTAYFATGQTFQLGPDGTGATFHRGGLIACSWGCLAVLAAKRATETEPGVDGALRIVAERERQVTAEGYSPEHDAEHPAGELATAGAIYAVHAVAPTAVPTDPPTVLVRTDGAILDAQWPWDPEWWKPKSIDRDLIRAGALIAAELDRPTGPRTVEP